MYASGCVYENIKTHFDKFVLLWFLLVYLYDILYNIFKWHVLGLCFTFLYITLDFECIIA